MKHSTLVARFISWIFITTAVFLSWFSFAINWDNSNFIDDTFWAQSPTSGDIVKAVFGTGVVPETTAYTRNWNNNSCVGSNITVEYVATNDLWNVTSLTWDLNGNTIYVLQWDQEISDQLSAVGSCMAIISEWSQKEITNANVNMAGLAFLYLNVGGLGEWFVLDGVKMRNIITRPNSPAKYGIFASSVKNLTINNTIVNTFSQAANTIGVYINNTNDVVIRKSMIHNNTIGVNIRGTSSRSLLDGLDIYNNTDFGIVSSLAGSYINVRNTRVANTQWIGVRFANGTHNIISNSTVTNSNNEWILLSATINATIDNVNILNNWGAGISLTNNANNSILNNIKVASTTNDAIFINGWTNNKYYGAIDLYGWTLHETTPWLLVAWSASDVEVINMWRTNGIMTPVATVPQIAGTPLLCELWVFHTYMLPLIWLLCDVTSFVGWFIDGGEPFYFGEFVLKQNAIPFYSGTDLYPSNNTFNSQLYITDNNFGGRIKTTGWLNYVNNFTQFTNSNTLQIYVNNTTTYTFVGDITPITWDTTSGTITRNIIRSAWDGPKQIYGWFQTTGTNIQETNAYRIFRRYDTTPATVPTLISPIAGATFLGNSVNLQRNASTDAGAWLSGYVYEVSITGTFATIFASWSTTLPTATIGGLWFQPTYYWRVKAIDNLGQESARSVVETFGYGFGSFSIVPVNTTFPTNSGQTFTVTAYDNTNSIITNYTNTVTFTLTGINTTPQTPPANYTFTWTDAGVHTFTGLLNINYPGVYTFDVMDTLSNTRLGTTTVTVVWQAPSMFSGTTTASNSATSGIVDIDIAASSYPTNYDISINGTPRNAGTLANAGTVPVDLSTLADGTYTITIVIDDGGYYTYTTTVTVILDTINPIVSINGPINWSYQTLNQPPLERSTTETGAGMSWYTVVMSGMSVVYTAYNHTNNTYRAGTPLSDGPRTMTLYGYDNAGNYGTSAISFVVDNTAPVILSWSPHQVVVINPITFNWSVLETGWVDYSNFWLMDYYNNLITNTVQVSGPATSVTVANLWLGTLAPGVYRWNVEVADNVGLWWYTPNNQWFVFMVHNALPGQLQWFMEFQSMRWNVVNIQGTLYTNTTQLQAALFANIASNVAINGNINPIVVWVPLLAPFPYSLQAINLTPGDGVKNISALFTAWSLNPYSVAKQITLDTTDPIPPILTTPINGVAVTGNIVLSRSGASDAGAWLSQYNIEVATGQSFTNVIRNDWVSAPTNTVTIPTWTLGTWVYYRRVVTNDNVRNQSTSEVGSFTIAAPNTTVVVNGTGAVPNSFSIPAITNANPNILYRSAPVTVWGLNNGQRANVSISAGTLIKNGTAIGTTGTAVNGDILEIDLLASSNYDTQVASTLTIGVKSAAFNLRTKTEDQSYNGMTNTQRLQIRIIFDSLVNTYGVNDTRTLTLMVTLRTAIESMLWLTNYNQSQKDALEYFLTLVNGYINDRWGANPLNGATYTARNGRVFSITYDTTRSAYTSPQFVKPAYFSSWTAMKLHIDVHNTGAGQGVLVGTLNNIESVNRGNNVHVMPNGKIYRTEQSGGKRYSPDTISQRQFNSQSELLARLRANNPSIRHY